jgi:pSer/pThr/pTyr-binding forkhead associated (FHA) protein
MVQLRILSGQMAGELQVIRHFPFRIGRSPEDDLCLDDDGVWENHLTLELEKETGFTLTTHADAFVAVNDQPQAAARLRNGDIITFGSAKIQFWLAAPRQHGLGFREAFVWIILAAVTAAQCALIYRLLK